MNQVAQARPANHLREIDVLRTPVSRHGQLSLLERQLRWCEDAVRTAQQGTAATMHRLDASEEERWAAVRRLRDLVWKVSGEILPLVSRIPPGLHTHPTYTEVMRAAHQLRRTAEDALRDNADHTIALASGWGVPDAPVR